MTSTPQSTQADEWLDYYARFSYFSPEKIRKGCHPRLKEHPQAAQKAIVLVHGLSDSPYYMTAIGDFFYNHLGYNVYIPLLHCHGLEKPNGMEGVELEEWKANVSFAISTAASKSEEISIGGLSTGGALSFYMAANKPRINGAVYLFSAALDLAGGRFGLIGDLKERLLRTFLADFFDRNKPLIGDNPYRYSHVDIDGAVELARLIKENDIIIDEFSESYPFSKKVFAAHSEYDETAEISGIEELEKVSIPEHFTFYRIAKDKGIKHASLVLKDPVEKDGKILEEPNSEFMNMMRALAEFENL